MSDRSDDARILETVRAYRESLAGLTNLYSSAGKQISERYQWLIKGKPEDFVQQMEDLQRGLAMKIFAELAPLGPVGSMEQRQIGRVLLGHLWNQPILGPELREAVDWLITESQNFRWEDLLQPFAALPPLRDRWGELSSVVMQMANLVAKSDGQIEAAEQLKLRMLQSELDRLREMAPERFGPHADAQRMAVDQVARGAERLRHGDQFPAAAPSRQHQNRTIPEPTPAKQAAPPPRQATQSSPTRESTQKTPEQPELTPEERLAAALQKLDELIGLKSIKDQIKTLTNFLKLEKLRQEADLPTTKLALHMSFVGNPGTGKTSVARIVADIFGALGILSRGQLVETDRSGLVAEYAGQTGPKTNAKIDEALDGVLFIDEAYTLVSSDGQDQYGREAVQTLLKRMEDARDRLIVVLAGYPLEMQMMIRSNPGLTSRVGQTFEFPDYTPGEMGRIFGLMSGKSKYQLPTETRRRVLHGFAYLHARRDRHFGNGRTVRNSFEASVRKLANRLADAKQITRELLTKLEPEDVEIPGVMAAHLKALADQQINVQAPCPHCHTTAEFPDLSLGNEVECASCKKKFILEWGEPVFPPPQETANQ